jgi:hypothetical protein
MKGKCLAIAMATLVLGLAPQMARAQTLKASASINKARAKGDLGVVVSESGLAAKQAVSYSLTAYAGAVYTCNGVAQPQVGGPEEVDFGMTASSKGVTRDTVVVMVPESPCDIGQTSKMTQASYSNVTVTDITDGVSIALGDYAASF